MRKTIGVLAHVDAGKTTFCEQFLFHTNNLKTRGRVDHKNSFMDIHDIEKKRGITVFSGQATIDYNGSTYYLIDTPGHVDFSPEMQRAIKIMDYAVIIISAVEGVQGHTETVWNLLKKNNVPTFFFINKVDRIGADVDGVLKEIKKSLTSDVYYLKSEDKYLNEEMIEFVAERDENCLDEFINGNGDYNYWDKAFIGMIKTSKLSLCMSGSALQDEGIKEFIERLDMLTETNYQDDEDFAARVYKVKYDERKERVTFLKIIKGSINVRDLVSYHQDEETEKITQIRKYSGDKFERVNEARAGDLIAVLGISKAVVGDGIGDLNEKAHFVDMTTLKSKVIFESGENPREALGNFYLLDIEEPSLKVEWNEKFEQIHVQVMGVIQLEVLEQLVRERFGYVISFGTPQVIYKESIIGVVRGYGHFEPLGHYSEVHLEIEETERGSGITFENKCHADMMTVGNQNLVRTHVFERKHHGLLTGSEITDVRITLLTGKAHNKHTSGGDFREATYRAIRQGLEKAKNVLLEPYYEFKIRVDQEYMGRVISDIQRYFGEFDPPLNNGDDVTITGIAPVSSFMNYSSELVAFTKGRGRISLKFIGYRECHNQDEIISQTGYNKDADSEYVSSSIFCSKGKSYSLEWNECEKEMHREI